MKKIILLLASVMLSAGLYAQETLKIGIIGLDTSHSTAFSKLINTGDEEWAKGFKVVAAYPYGSKTIQSSYERIPKYTEEVQKYGVEIVESIPELLDKVDCIFLETNDGRLHLEQAVEVFKAGKKVFIDKPVGATLADAIAIYALAEKYGIKTFSSSALRFASANVAARAGEYGEIFGADCYSPHKVEPTHPDYGFYGIHGVESLYTIMGTGCKEVCCLSSELGDVVVGKWDNGKIGTFRAVVKGPNGYGGTILSAKKKFSPAGKYEGYKPLLEEVLEFFRTDVLPVSNEETIEIFAFMKAANMSKAKGGQAVSLEEAYKIANKEAKKLIKKYNE